MLSRLKRIPLSLIGISLILVSLLVYAVTGKLGLFIHPGYIPFTVISSIVGLVALIWFAVLSFIKNKDYKEPSKNKKISVSSILVLLMGILMISITPIPLSSQYGFNTVETGSVTNFEATPNQDWSKLSLMDWSGVLKTSQQGSFYGEPVELTGYVSKIDKDTFYLSRYTIYCCTVDAQLAQVPVYYPNWEDKLSSDDWTTISGSFEESSISLSYPIVLIPSTELSQISVPSDPYSYGY